MKSVRESFVAVFGEEEAQALEEAALEHANGTNDLSKGSDPFKWTILMVIGYQCAEKYSEYHKINAPWEQIKDWAKLEGNLESHDGDCDFLAMLAGIYDEYLPKERTA